MCATVIGLRGERDRDRGHQLDAFGVLGGEREWEERIARTLERVHAVIPVGLDVARGFRHRPKLRGDQGCVDLHGSRCPVVGQNGSGSDGPMAARVAM